MTSLDSILKSRDITLPTKVCLVKATVFPAVMYECELDYNESWAPKNGCFWTVVLKKAPESPLDCKEIQPVHPKGNQSWIFIGRTDIDAGHLMWRTDSFEKTLRLGKIKAGGERDDRGWDGLMASLTQWTWVWINSGSWWWTGRPGVLHSMGSQNWTRRRDWSELNLIWPCGRSDYYSQFTDEMHREFK